MTIGIIWINHHGMIARLRVADHSILVLNLLVLMTIVILPFATELIAQDLRSGGSAENAAAAVYAGALLLMSVDLLDPQPPRADQPPSTCSGSASRSRAPADPAPRRWSG